MKQVSPEFNWEFPHLRLIRKDLADVSLGLCKRLIINLPPQHGKSEGITVRYPVWSLERNPLLRVGVTAYGQHLANTFSRKARRVAAGRLNISTERNAVDEWETIEGGAFIARGVGAGITGHPLDGLLIEDPYKDAKQALSVVYRQTVWEWYTDALKTRLSKDAWTIIVHTRWAVDDLTGRLEKEGGWRIVSVPAICEKTDDPLGRVIGDALCPDLHPIEQLRDAERGNPTSFRALYQQHPLDLEGGFFKGLEKIPLLDVAPTADQFTRITRFWDLASTEKQAGADPDFAAGVKMGKHKDGRFIVLNVIRVRLGPSGVRGLIRQTAELDGQSVYIRVEREGGASGKITSNVIVCEDLVGFKAASIKPTTGKEERAEPWGAQIEAGNVVIVKDENTQAFLAEHQAFPSGSHDDMVDAASGAFADVSRPGAFASINGERI